MGTFLRAIYNSILSWLSKSILVIYKHFSFFSSWNRIAGQIKRKDYEMSQVCMLFFKSSSMHYLVSFRNTLNCYVCDRLYADKAWTRFHGSSQVPEVLILCWWARFCPNWAALRCSRCSNCQEEERWREGWARSGTHREPSRKIAFRMVSNVRLHAISATCNRSGGVLPGEQHYAMMEAWRTRRS